MTGFYELEFTQKLTSNVMHIADKLARLSYASFQV